MNQLAAFSYCLILTLFLTFPKKSKQRFQRDKVVIEHHIEFKEEELSKMDSLMEESQQIYWDNNISIYNKCDTIHIFIYK